MLPALRAKAWESSAFNEPQSLPRLLKWNIIINIAHFIELINQKNMRNSMKEVELVEPELREESGTEGNEKNIWHLPIFL